MKHWNERDWVLKNATLPTMYTLARIAQLKIPCRICAENSGQFGSYFSQFNQVTLKKYSRIITPEQLTRERKAKL